MSQEINDVGELVKVQNVIQIKRGADAPTKDDLADGELGYSRNKKTLYIRDANLDNNGTYNGIVAITGGTGSGTGSGGPTIVETDISLTQGGVPADAKAVGDRLKQIYNIDLTDTDNPGLLQVLDKKVDTNTSDLYAKIEALTKKMEYEEISIVEFLINNSTSNIIMEKGTSLNSLKFSWALSKIPTKLQVEDWILLNLKEGSFSPSDFTPISSNDSWTLKATDEENFIASKKIQLIFKDPFFCGSVLPPEGEYDETFILGLSAAKDYKKDYVNDYISKFTFDTDIYDKIGRYVYYCCPEDSRYSYYFSSGVMEFPMNKVASVDFTNGGKHGPIKYQIFRSVNADLGNETVTVTRNNIG